MKGCFSFVLLLVFSLHNSFAQKLVLNEYGFSLNEKERGNIELLAQYEAMLYNGIFNTRKNDSLKITINIYKKFSDYKKACAAIGAPMLSREGFFSPALRQVFVYKHPEFMTTLVHEMSHCFMNYNMGRPPRWLNEGIAVFFESLAVEDGQVSVTTQPARIAAVKRELSDDNIHLDEFFRLGNEAWTDKSKMNYMYNVSYSIVFLIIKTDPGIAGKIIHALKGGAGSITAIESVFGSIDNFSMKYRLFYRQ